MFCLVLEGTQKNTANFVLSEGAELDKYIPIYNVDRNHRYDFGGQAEAARMRAVIYCVRWNPQTKNDNSIGSNGASVYVSIYRYTYICIYRYAYVLYIHTY